MIADARVLQPEFVPREVQHRDAEVNTLSSYVRPLTDGQTPDPVLLYGPSGVGKTCIAQFVMERLRESVVELNHQYVNCWDDHTRFQTLHRLLEGINRAYDIHRQSTPRDVLLDRLRDYDGPPYVVILDEVDQLQDKDLLYELHRIRHLSIIFIANREEDVFASLDERLQSRLRNSHRIHFTRYSNQELAAILQVRARAGLADSVINKQRLGHIAEHATGDARIAIGILRKAAQAAHTNGYGEIRTETIEAAVSEAQLEIEREVLSRLKPHQQTIYDIIHEAGEIDPPTLYGKYERQVGDPKTNRTVRNYLAKLEQYNLIEATGNTKARQYRVTD